MGEYNIAVYHPDEFLVSLYHLQPQVVVHTLHEQGEALNPPQRLECILKTLQKQRCGGFVELVSAELGLTLESGAV